MQQRIYYHGEPGAHYGIWNVIEKCWQFDICEDTPMLAKARLHQKIGHDARRICYEPRRLPAKMPENRMPEVARLFGKELGEEFEVHTQDRPKITVSIRENGVFTKDGKRTIWILERLLTGESEIVEE